MTSKEELIMNLKEHAEACGLKLNDDWAVLDAVIKGLLRNKESHGENYCPCRNINVCKESGRDLICPCATHLKDAKGMGHCNCWLFIKA